MKLQTSLRIASRAVMAALLALGIGASFAPVARAAGSAADHAAYQDVEYVNASKPGPSLIVLTGQIKSSNATFLQQVQGNNIADFAELELTKANFNVLERQRLGDLLDEFNTAYSLGDPARARQILEKGKVASTHWMVKFDILRAEPVAQAGSSVDGRGLSKVAGALGSLAGLGSTFGAARSTAETVDTRGSKSTWLVGMRYTILNAATTEQVASGYVEEKMEATSSASSVAGIGHTETSGGTLDSMVLRLVQRSVAQIDARNK